MTQNVGWSQGVGYTTAIPHQHCWHTRIDTASGNPPPPMHCCYCNEPYRIPLITTSTTQYHGPYA